MNRIEANLQALQSAILKAGSQLAFARSLTRKDGSPVAQSTVGTWLAREQQIAPEYCAQVEHLYGVRCEELRGDLQWVRNERGIATGWHTPVLPALDAPTQAQAA